MLNQIGFFVLFLTFFLSLYSFSAVWIYLQKRKLGFLKSSVSSAIWAFVAASVSLLILLWQFYISDFSNAFVAGHSNVALPLFYRLTAVWAGQEGSLVLWSWILFFMQFLAIKIYFFRERSLWRTLVPGLDKGAAETRFHSLFPYVLAVLSANALFFSLANLIGSNAFLALHWQDAQGAVSAFIPRDGNGLNPLLQHPAMVIHPPLLYIGFVGLVIPFSFAVAALWSRQLGEVWIKVIRRWTITVWLFLTAGIILGGHWAYVELGWGGYWAWDPVENGSLLPWLTSTAFLHSVIIQEKRGMLKVWNVSLILLTYLLVIVATLITRSGLISSVHSFAQSNVGPLFTFFLATLAVASVYLVATRLPLLSSEHKLDSLVSRESSFLYNNLVFLTMTLTILWGTIFPLVSEAITGNKITVGPEYFNRINIPLALLLLLLTGLGPMLAWRKTSSQSLMKNLLWPAIAMVAITVIVFYLKPDAYYAALTLGLSAFVMAGVLLEFIRGFTARLRQHRENIFLTFLNMMRQNQRRYGGYIVHAGIVIMFAGFSGNAWNMDQKMLFDVKESHNIGNYSVQVEELINGSNANYIFTKVQVAVKKDGQVIARLLPEKRIYHASQQPSSEVGIFSTWYEDLYVVFEGIGKSGATGPEKIEMHIWRKPLVSFVWIGGFVILLGIIIALLPGLRCSGSIVPLDATDDLQARKESLLRNIKDLDLDWQMGKFAEEDYQRMRAEYMEALSHLLEKMDQQSSAGDAVDLEQKQKSRKDQPQFCTECTQCGHKVGAGDHFCSMCGKPLQQPEAKSSGEIAGTL